MRDDLAFSHLLDLQEVDLEIDRLLHRRQSLPELDAYRAAHHRRQEAEAERDRVGEELRSLERDLDKAEGELEILEAKLKESETRLFAGGMSSRETEHKRLEVQSLRGQQEAMETKVLHLLDRREQLQEALGVAAGRVEQAAGEEARLEAVIAAAWKEIDADLARREARKAEIVPLVPSELLELYEKLRGTKEGVAVGRLEHGVCGGCHLQLSATEQAEAFAADPPRCIHCRRIIVA